MFSSRLLFVLLFSLSVAAYSQSPRPEATPPADDDDSVRITTALIQMDVVVTDKDGKPIIDLAPEDFLLYQDGNLQKITNLSYISPTKGQKVDLISSKRRRDKNEPPPPPSNIRTNQGRIVTFVVDDGNCVATINGTATIRDAMKKFINEQMLPDDKVAIYRTRGGASLLQMYTSNREVLKRTVEKINLIPSGACGSAFEAIRDNSTLKATGSGAESFESEGDKKFRTDNENRERDNQVIGTIGVLGFVVDRLKNVPQRKLVFLLSEGIVTKFDSRAYDALRELADKATRSSVVINTMSAKGVTVPGMLSAQDEVLPGIISGSDQTFAATEGRLDEERALNEGLSYLAYTTGGRFVRNQNFLDGAIKKILDAETGYYLIGYEPSDETFKGKEFHRIEVKLNRPDLRVSSRKGFYGRTDKESQPVYRTADSPLYQAISSPFQENGMELRMTMLFGHNPADGNFLRALIHVKGQDLTFVDDTGGMKKVVLDVVAVALDERGKVVEEFNRTYPIRVPKEGAETVLRNGLDFSTDVPIKKAGVYSFRLAVRDNSTKRLGSAGDFIEIPDAKKVKFHVSGLIATGLDENGRPILTKKRPIDSSFAPVFSSSIPSIRQFSKGSSLAYAYTIYNARSDGSRSVSISRQIRLFRNGQIVVEGPEKPITHIGQKDLTRIEDFGTLRLGDAVDPGEYVLQIIVRDKVADNVSSQWVDFEVVP